MQIIVLHTENEDQPFWRSNTQMDQMHCHFIPIAVQQTKFQCIQEFQNNAVLHTQLYAQPISKKHFETFFYR